MSAATGAAKACSSPCTRRAAAKPPPPATAAPCSPQPLPCGQPSSSTCHVHAPGPRSPSPPDFTAGALRPTSSHASPSSPPPSLPSSPPPSPWRPRPLSTACGCASAARCGSLQGWACMFAMCVYVCFVGGEGFGGGRGGRGGPSSTFPRHSRLPSRTSRTANLLPPVRCAALGQPIAVSANHQVTPAHELHAGSQHPLTSSRPCLHMPWWQPAGCTRGDSSCLKQRRPP